MNLAQKAMFTSGTLLRLDGCLFFFFFLVLFCFYLSGPLLTVWEQIFCFCPDKQKSLLLPKVAWQLLYTISSSLSFGKPHLKSRIYGGTCYSLTLVCSVYQFQTSWVCRIRRSQLHKQEVAIASQAAMLPSKLTFLGWRTKHLTRLPNVSARNEWEIHS